MTEPTFVETPLDKAQRELREAITIYDEAERESRFASNKATAALNRLNAKQKAFDAAVAEMRKTAPGQSDWKQRHNGGIHGV